MFLLCVCVFAAYSFGFNLIWMFYCVNKPTLEVSDHYKQIMLIGLLSTNLIIFCILLIVVC
jgi:hypothetical protein